ncbi:MAG: phospholipase [Spongiibacteraceae bacterium]|nr:phospholipase [Spongiibacteraceae bacterium]
MSWLIISLHIGVMALALVHALIYKRDHRAALGWVGVIVLFPIAGPVLYFIFGINRIRLVARNFSGHYLPFLHFGYERADRQYTASSFDAEPPLPAIMRVGKRATREPVSSGNRIEMLFNGEAFFPRLIAAIDGATQSVLLSSYLFSPRGIGKEVILAMSRAVTRGVAVRVIIDGTGALYSARTAFSSLRKAGVDVAEFMPPSLIPPSFGVNLRNHRKIAIVDGREAFFGGINIDSRHMVDDPDNSHKTKDVHFLATGPVVQSLQKVFRRDWWMATRQELKDLPSPQEGGGSGSVCCRVIDDGPDENLDALAMTLLGLFSAARESITIMTPYFLLSRELLSALQSASLRGVQVQVVIPQRSNLRFIDWATRNMLWELLLWDVKVYAQPAPFAHTKLLAIDGEYVMAGSANMDSRSLRLNFELGVEMYDKALAKQVSDHIQEAIAVSRRVTLAEVDKRPIHHRLRDAFFWLFSSYL